MNTKTTIKVEKLTATALNRARQGNTQDTYIMAMLQYFSDTNINPMKASFPLSEQLTNGIERIVKMVKAIERDKINFLVEGLKELKEKATFKSNEYQIEGVSESDLLKVAEEITRLQGELDQVKSERNNYLLEVDKLRENLRQASSGGTTIGHQIIIDLIHSFERQINNLSDREPIILQRTVITDVVNKLKKSIE